MIKESNFVDIDRDKENKDIIKYQRTKNKLIFEEIYKNRIQTLQIWARKYKYLMDDSADDMFSALTTYFIKAVDGYKIKKGSFNTYLYTLLINGIRNMVINKKAIKRKPWGSDVNTLSNYTLSLDYRYDNNNTLKDIIEDKIDKHDLAGKMKLKEVINVLSKDDISVRDFLTKLSRGETLSTVLRERKIRKGTIRINKAKAKLLKREKKHKKIVGDLIKENIRGAFVILDYKIRLPNRLHYVIEMRKSKEANFVLKNIRKWRQDKQNLMRIIKGK